MGRALREGAVGSKRERRQREIIGKLSAQPGLRVGELSELLSVSTETIRRDLDDLTGQGLLNRTYGGAILTQGGEPALSQRHGLLVAERSAIALAAVPCLAGAGTLMIGSGATTMHVARRIAMEMTRITVITHSFGVATVPVLQPHDHRC